MGKNNQRNSNQRGKGLKRGPASGEREGGTKASVLATSSLGLKWPRLGSSDNCRGRERDCWTGTFRGGQSKHTGGREPK